MTIMETHVRVPDHDSEPTGFDPLAAFYGRWNTRLVERYRPLLSYLFPGKKVECVRGRLVVSPTEASGNSYGEGGLIAMLRAPARAAGFLVYGPLNLAFDPETYVIPDVCVLHQVPETKATRTWVPADHFTMPVEFVSPSSQVRDQIDKPELYAAHGIPYFMRVMIDSEQRSATITQLKLVRGMYKTVAEAVTGERFTMTEPFGASFDVDELLEPR